MLRGHALRDDPQLRAVAWRLFLAAWIAYASFHQGGGWNQNARFAMVRAIVEEGRFSIDDHVLYVRGERDAGGSHLARVAVENGGYRHGGREVVLAWSGSGEPLRGEAAGATLARIDAVAATGDVSFADGRLHPNKAPGTALLAVPAYFAVYHIERALGLDPDDWWVLTVNAWLTSALSVGALAALGCVFFLALAVRLAEGRLAPATWATLAFAFGTAFFPYATMLFDHDVVAVGLLAAVYFAVRAGEAALPGPRARGLLLCGLATGWAVISNYAALGAVPVLAAALLRRPGAWAWFGLGAAGPLILAAGYHWVCFGSPFTSAYHFEDPLFLEASGLFNVFGPPSPEALVAVLISPYRGLFFSAPVLVPGLMSLVAMLREPASGGRRGAALLFAALAGVFLLFTICFNGWYGGWGIGPRYLIPALPFLALPLVSAFERAFAPTLVLTALSIAGMTLFTAVDPQSPIGTSPIAARPDRSRLLREPLSEYTLPIFVTGRAAPILEAQIADRLQRSDRESIAAGATAAEREDRRRALRARLEAAVATPGSELPLAHFRGPVSANPVGVYESWIARLFPPSADELRWNSFNAGELLLPGSRASLLLPLAAVLPLVASALRRARRADDLRR